MSDLKKDIFLSVLQALLIKDKAIDPYEGASNDVVSSIVLNAKNITKKISQEIKDINSLD